MNAAALLDSHPTETLCVRMCGAIDYANRSAVRLLAGDGDGEGMGSNFFALFADERAAVRDKILQCAGSSAWQPLSLTLGGGGHEGLRLSLRCRGLREGGEVRAMIVSDEGRRQVFDDHRRLVREMNAELAEQHRVLDRLDEALRNETKLRAELIHRVKNNLTLLISLIRTRVAGSTDPAVRQALDDIQARVMSIALVHDLLDRNKEIDIVDAKELLEHLCRQMETSICPPGITIKRELTPYKLHVSEATPLCLLVNELVTNSLKHAFKEEGVGQVRVALKRNGVDKLEVSVADNGRGFETGGLEDRGTGSRIVRGLAEQLRGQLAVESDAGTTWQLIFAPMEVKEAA